jgi:tetratricopeptide (TPR) repeat protein
LQFSDPFQSWQKALSLDSEREFETSKSWFSQAARFFFDSGSDASSHVGRAFFEYSTLMDAFASVQQARQLKLNSKYEESLSEFTRAAEILRSSVHFGFLSGYESGCATLESALEIKDPDEAFQAIKNAIALFEQSKLALGFRDERHPIVDVIDSLIKYSISEAFLAESKSLSQNGKNDEAHRKIQQSRAIAVNHEVLASKAGTKPRSIDYFPLMDWNRARSTGFLVSFPEQDSIWLGNVGSNSVIVETLGKNKIDQVIDPLESVSCPVSSSSKGRIRVVYVDLKEQKKYDEGCLLMI